MAFSLQNLHPTRMNDWDFVTELLTLGFISGNESSREALKKVTSLKICYELYKRLGAEDQRIVILRAHAINNVAEYVKKNPRASEKELSVFVKKEIETFALKVAQLT